MSKVLRMIDIVYVIFIALFLALILYSPLAASQERVKEIQVYGLQRVTLGRLLSSMEIRQGTVITDKDISQAVKDVFSTGYFDDVSITQQQGIVYIKVSELPAINEIIIKGSKLIKEEQIKEVLESSGIQEGEILRNAQFEIILNELEALYAEQGRYGTKIEATTEVLAEGNVVNININIVEGNPAKIARINILGNKAFRDKELKELMSLRARGKWNSQGSKIKYSRTKLVADLDTLTQYYLNNGYAKAVIVDNVVSINKDRDLININIQISEGKRYKLKSLQIIGDTIVPKQDIFARLTIEEGNFFSQQAISASNSLIVDILGDKGYGLAATNTVYEYDDLLGTISANIYVQPGQKTYIRNIDFIGNKKSQHTALRRYLQQYEGSPYSSSSVARSLSAIRRLPYVANAQVERKAIANQPDKVDLLFIIEESPSGNIGGGLFYSDLDGISLSFSFTDNNFYGKGNSFSSNIKYGRVSQEIGFSIGQPFINLDGVSANYFLRYRETDFDVANIANYALTSATMGVSFGYPISFNNRINYGLSFNNLNIFQGTNPQQEISNYTRIYGDKYSDAAFTTTVSHNSLNRGFKPTDGRRTSFSLGFQVPIDGGERPTIYEASLNHITYFKLSPSIDELAFSIRFNLAHFNTWQTGENVYLPFYKRYYLGGANSVRGFQPNSLGPRSTTSAGRASTSSQGGNLLILGRTEFIFPLTGLSNDVSNIRTSLFWDIGNVFNTRCIVKEPHCEIPITYKELRQSIGFSLRWYIQFFPLTFSISSPINAQENDRTLGFQFSFGDL